MIYAANRYDMLRHFPLNGITAEVGVFAGVFSRVMVSRLRPQLHYAVDNWSAGKFLFNGQLVDARDAEALCRAEFAGEVQQGTVEILKGDSTHILALLPDGWLNVCYVDASHDYASVLADLEATLPKMKSGGWIAGHDYCMICGFGVVRATAVFCDRHKLHIGIMTDEDERPVRSGDGRHVPRFPAELAYNSFAIGVK
jgi:hypothetical protein